MTYTELLELQKKARVKTEKNITQDVELEQKITEDKYVVFVCVVVAHTCA